MKVARFENENDDVFQFPIRLRMKSVAPEAIYRSLKVIFYKKTRRLRLSKQSKVDRNRKFSRFRETAW